MTKLVSVGIVGATGYTGLELVQLLHNHPHCELTTLFSTSQAGVLYSDIYPHFKNKCDLELQDFQPNNLPELDVLFLAVPHAETHKYMADIIQKHPQMKIIDLSADFRVPDPSGYKQYYDFTHQSDDILKTVVYGCPELFREELKTAQLCAAPGCYATAIILGLHPLSKAGILPTNIIVDAKSGVSGAGKSAKLSNLYCETNESCSAYGTGNHRHLMEINHYLGAEKLFFSPHLIPQHRGILASIYFESDNTDLESLYKETYQNEPFLTINNTSASTRNTAGSNNCVITITQPKPNQYAIFVTIDNLLKGASGQAVQCMNIMLGIDELTNLPTVASPL